MPSVVSASPRGCLPPGTAAPGSRGALPGRLHRRTRICTRETNHALSAGDGRSRPMAQNLGPLVISTTVWRLPDDGLGDDLHARLADAIVARARRRPRGPRGGDCRLEEALLTRQGPFDTSNAGLLAALGVLGRKTDSWDAMWGGPRSRLRLGSSNRALASRLCHPPADRCHGPPKSTGAPPKTNLRKTPRLRRHRVGRYPKPGGLPPGVQPTDRTVRLQGAPRCRSLRSICLPRAMRPLGDEPDPRHLRQTRRPETATPRFWPGVFPGRT